MIIGKVRYIWDIETSLATIRPKLVEVPLGTRQRKNIGISNDGTLSENLELFLMASTEVVEHILRTLRNLFSLYRRTMSTFLLVVITRHFQISNIPEDVKLILTTSAKVVYIG